MVGFINLYYYSGINPAYYPLTRVSIPHPAWPNPNPPPPSGSSSAGLIIGLILGFLALGVGGFFGYRYWRK